MNGKAREDFLSNLQEGNIVAFKIGDYMYSGKVTSVVDNLDVGKIVTIKTKNGSVYYPHISDIIWIKNGSHWPTGIFNALKESKKR